jgi:hypothetical protein
MVPPPVFVAASVLLRVSQIPMRSADAARNVATARTTPMARRILRSPRRARARPAFRLARPHKAQRPSGPAAIRWRSHSLGTP